MASARKGEHRDPGKLNLTSVSASATVAAVLDTELATTPAHGMRVPTQERALRTRAALVRAGEREFSEHGHAATTTRSIAQRAGVATGSFYQYFPDKDALLREIAARRLGRVHELALGGLERAPRRPSKADVHAQARELMGLMVEAVMAYHRDDPRLHAVLTERRHTDGELDALTTAAERALVGRIARLIERWGHSGDRTATAFVLFNMVEGAVHAHVLGARMVSDERFVEALATALVRVALGDVAPQRAQRPHRSRR
jgi:AcrR family transcriptional regulator